MTQQAISSIARRIRADNPAGARRVAKTIYEAVAELRQFQRRGRVGLAPDTRELIFAPWPYVAVYEIIEDHVVFLRIRHTSQNWPG